MEENKMRLRALHLSYLCVSDREQNVCPRFWKLITVELIHLKLILHSGLPLNESSIRSFVAACLSVGVSGCESALLYCDCFSLY